MNTFGLKAAALPALGITFLALLVPIASQSQSNSDTKQSEAPSPQVLDKEPKQNPTAPISDKEPSNDMSKPAVLALGEIVKGRLGNSDETGKYHYWLVTLPIGTYKIVLDIKRCDEAADVAGNLVWFSIDGEKVQDLGGVATFGEPRSRMIKRFEVKRPLRMVLRYANQWTISDYWLGLFKEGTAIRSPFFAKCPITERTTIGKTVTALLDGSDFGARDSWYSIELGPGDYKIITEWSRADNKRDSAGDLASFDLEGTNCRQITAAAAFGEFSTRKVVKLSLADKTTLVLRLRASWAKEVAALSVTKILEE